LLLSSSLSFQHLDQRDAHGNPYLKVKMARTLFGIGFSTAEEKAAAVKSRYNSRKIPKIFLKNPDNPVDLVKRYSPNDYLHTQKTNYSRKYKDIIGKF